MENKSGLFQIENKVELIFTKTPKQIERETGRRFVDICKELLSEGLSPTEIAQKLKLRGSDPVQTSLYKERLADKRNIQYPELADQSTEDLISICPTVIGMEYKEFIYQKYIIEGMSAAKIASIIGQNAKKIERHIKSFGFTKSPTHARKDSVRSGVINYQEIVVKSRQTRRKSNSFSNTQEIVRDMFKNHLESQMLLRRSEDVEIILGFDEIGILGDREVDIPIIVFRVNDNIWYKFSVEFNGEHVHAGKRLLKDNEKISILKKKGWKHFTLWYSSSNKKLEEQVNIIVMEILTTVFRDQ